MPESLLTLGRRVRRFSPVLLIAVWAMDCRLYYTIFRPYFFSVNPWFRDPLKIAKRLSRRCGDRPCGDPASAPPNRGALLVMTERLASCLVNIYHSDRIYFVLQETRITSKNLAVFIQPTLAVVLFDIEVPRFIKRHMNGPVLGPFIANSSAIDQFEAWLPSIALADWKEWIV
jgi:hypothetical protein